MSMLNVHPAVLDEHLALSILMLLPRIKIRP